VDNNGHLGSSPASLALAARRTRKEAGTRRGGARREVPAPIRMEVMPVLR
jgi:hypothetical protein